MRRVLIPASAGLGCFLALSHLVGLAASPNFSRNATGDSAAQLELLRETPGGWQGGRRKVSHRPSKSGQRHDETERFAARASDGISGDQGQVTRLPGRRIDTAVAAARALAAAQASPVAAPVAAPILQQGPLQFTASTAAAPGRVPVPVGPTALPVPEAAPTGLPPAPMPAVSAGVAPSAAGLTVQVQPGAGGLQVNPVTAPPPGPGEFGTFPAQAMQIASMHVPAAGAGGGALPDEFGDLGPRRIRGWGRPDVDVVPGQYRPPPTRLTADKAAPYDPTILGQGPVGMPEPPPGGAPLPPGFGPPPGGVPGGPGPSGPADPNSPAPAEGGTEETVRVDFKDTELRSIVKMMSDRLKVNFVIDPTLSGKVTVLGPQELPISQAELLLKFLLEYSGYGTEGTGAVRRVVKKDKARGAFTPIQRELSPDAGTQSEQLSKMVIHVFRFKHVNVNEMLNLFRFVSDPGSLPPMQAYAPANLMFVIDNELNLRRLARLAQDMDVPGPVRRITPVKLNHANAKALADKVTQILTKRSEGEADPGTREYKMSKPSLMADERTNGILVLCLEEDVRMIVSLIEQLDSDDVHTPTVKVIHLQYTEAEAVATQVNQAFKVGGGGTDPSVAYGVIADSRTQSLILSGYSDQMLRKVEDLIQFLDNPVTPGDGVNIHHYRMEYGNAVSVEKILSGVESGGAQGQAGTTKIIADEASNSLVIVASKAKFQDIQNLLRKLDSLRPQVLMETLIVDLTFDHARSLGADLNLIPANTPDSRAFLLGVTGAVSSLFDPTGNGGINLGVLAPETFDLQAAATGDVAERSKIQYLFRMFSKDDRASILQNPTLMASDNSTSKITVGEKVQIPQGVSTVQQPGQIPFTNFTSEELGLTMELTPRITKGDWVSLKLKTEIKARTGASLNFGPFQTPVFTKTSVENEVQIKNEATLVIGGLIREDKQKQVRKIPGLGDLPLLGRLFQTVGKTSVKRDLLIFITPHIARDEFSARRVTKAEERSLQWRDIPSHTWPHEQGRPVTPGQIVQDLKRGGSNYRTIHHKPPKLKEVIEGKTSALRARREVLEPHEE